jgi:hypothetical protein
MSACNEIILTFYFELSDGNFNFHLRYENFEEGYQKYYAEVFRISPEKIHLGLLKIDCSLHCESRLRKELFI